jgi:hypothetical protein
MPGNLQTEKLLFPTPPLYCSVSHYHTPTFSLSLSNISMRVDWLVSSQSVEIFAAIQLL